MFKKCECAAHSAAECCCGAWDEPDYKALWKQMCQRCDELDAKLAEAEKQEPVAYMYPDDLEEFKTREMSAHAYSLEMVSPTQGDTVPLYTHPQPKREWVGLTVEDINKAIEDNQRFGGFRKVGFAYDLEAVLKEKNT